MTAAPQSDPDAHPPQPIDVAIVGSGFGGLCMALRLLQEGMTNFVVLEKDGDVGGTWRDNTYPGCACDVQSHLYSLSFEGNPEWSKRYAPWDEIQSYILDTTERHGLRDYVRFNTEVNSTVFDEATALWAVGTTDGQTLRARHVVIASGPLHFPLTPNIPGLDSFEGKVFHSARWDHDYDLKGKRVVSIGTGGSAIQYIPRIAEEVGQLHVMQRSAPWVIPRDERAYSRFSKWMFRTFPLLRKLHRARLYWSNESRAWPIFTPSIASRLGGLVKRFITMNVDDPALAERLTPDYTLGCKRILISNEYYPAFNRDNVELVTEAIKEIRAGSVVTADGVERPMDCIILGTGFVADPRIYMKHFEVVGLGGRRLQDDWDDHVESYYGVDAAGYPNMHLLVGPNSGLGHNSIIFMIEAQVNYILKCMQMLRARAADYMDVKADVQTEFNERVQTTIGKTVWGTGCQSWYQQADGRNIALWPWSTWRFWLETRHVREDAYTFGSATTAVTTDAPALPQQTQGASAE